MTFRYELVERIPNGMSPGVVYHSEEFELAGLLCACGCGHRITLLVPDGHKVFEERGGATIDPSVGVLDGPCGSHFVVTAGQIHWLPPFTSAQATSIIRNQIARHVARDVKAMSWGQRLRAAIAAGVRRLTSVFRTR